MNITVIGLGLIGGSFCRAIKARTAHRVFGLDTDVETIAAALREGAIDGAVDSPKDSDLTIISLFPDATIEAMRQYEFLPGSIVMDICGVKESIVGHAEDILGEKGARYVGAHPMAGREFSGFAYSSANLFDGASFLLTPTSRTDPQAVDVARALAESIGFGRVILTTPADHDKNIAFTSQLAHVVSNAYIKSPTLLHERGFSAGSFQDLTRVAKLNENMWSDLFLRNRGNLLFEIDTLMAHLAEYRTALAEEDRAALEALLRTGRERKERSLMGEYQKTDSLQ